MKDIVEFEFIDAPFMTRCPIFKDAKITGFQDELSEEKRSWWNWNYDNPNDDRYAVNGYEQEGLFYHGLEQSLDMLYHVWRTAQENGKPFHGIFGFSQGAITASIFVDWMRKKESEGCMPTFLILVSAFLKPVPLNYPTYWMREQDKKLTDSLEQTYSSFLQTGTLPACFPLDVFKKENPSGFDPSDANDAATWQTIHGSTQDSTVAAEFFPTKEAISSIPSLHIVGLRDTIMPNSRSISLAKRYTGSTIYKHSFKRGHDVPSDAEDIAVMRHFIEKQQALC